MQWTAHGAWTVMAMLPRIFMPYGSTIRLASNASASNIPKMLRLEFAVVQDNANMRLDRFLRSQLKLSERPVPQQLICKWIREGKVTMTEGNNGLQFAKRDIQPNMRVQAGQRWQVIYVPRLETLAPSVGEAVESNKNQKPSQSAASLPLDQWVIYEDEDIVVLNKPAGVAVQGGTSVDLSIDGSLEDQTTSGLLIVGKNRSVTERLGKLFQRSGKGDDDLKKIGPRLIRLEGHMAKVNTGRHQSIQMLEDDQGLRAKRSRLEGNAERIWHCSADVKLIKSSKFSTAEGHYWKSVLRLWPHTGRKHQLRIQCAYQLQGKCTECRESGCYH
ncbi:hypothetical protein BGW42_000872 [Actinomortierella wolfii]|nr:hypothetical protein BGW42_000872 [Actinomortierella wolfii]